MTRSVLDVEVSYYETFYSESSQCMNLMHWLNDQTLKEAVEIIRNEPDEEMQKEQKKCLPGITVSGIFKRRCKSELITHTGLMSIDVDQKDNRHIKNFLSLKKEFSKIKYVAYAGNSVRGNGYFVIIPLLYPQRHEEQYEALKKNFHEMGIITDDSCRDVSRLRFYSYDPEGYFKHDAVPYPYCIERESKAKEKQTERVGKPPVMQKHPSQHSKKVESCINNILQHQCDITSEYHQWVKIGFALASEFGEEGRKYFHQVSQLYARYSQTQTDFQYSNCIRYNNGSININTFFFLCNQLRAIDARRENKFL